MSHMPIYLHFFFAFIATVGFSVFFNTPKKSLIPAGITGGIGWAVFVYLSKVSSNSTFSNFMAALTVSLLSEILARKLKQPAILFVIPGIIPLVPGLGMYNTMLYLVQENFEQGVSVGAETLFTGVAISLGVLVMSSLARTLNIIRFRNSTK